MRLYKFFWDTHRWTGIVLAVVFLNIAATGFLLLIKKDYDWIQPPTLVGEAGEVADFVTIEQVLQACYDSGHADFKTLEDVDRIDFRPANRVHKVHSVHNHSEIQVDAVTGKVLSQGWRASDLFEEIHDGSFYADWLHDWFMPIIPFALVFLVVSGSYLWLSPLLRKRRNRKKRAARTEPIERSVL